MIRHMFKPQFNMFDMVLWYIAVYLVGTNHSSWWILSVIPFALVSGFIQAALWGKK